MKHSQLVKLYNYLATRPAPPKKKTWVHMLFMLQDWVSQQMFTVCVLWTYAVRGTWGEGGKKAGRNSNIVKKLSVSQVIVVSSASW